MLIPLWVAIVIYVVASVACFAAYGLDKRAASRGNWRTPEKTLLLLGLIGGWPGALLGMSVFRHKTQKQPFRTLFWITVILNIALFVLLVTPLGPFGHPAT